MQVRQSSGLGFAGDGTFVDRVVVDSVGPMSETSLSGKKYVVTNCDRFGFWIAVWIFPGENHSAQVGASCSRAN